MADIYEKPENIELAASSQTGHPDFYDAPHSPLFK